MNKDSDASTVPETYNSLSAQNVTVLLSKPEQQLKIGDKVFQTARKPRSFDQGNLRRKALSITSILTTLITLIGRVSSDQFLPITANTATGMGTTLVEGVNMESRYIKYSSGTECVIYIAVSIATNGIKVMSTEGVPLATRNAALGHKTVINVKEPMKFIYANISANARRLRIDNNTGTIVTTIEESVNLINMSASNVNTYMSASYVEDSTVYIFVCGTVDWQWMRRLVFGNLGDYTTHLNSSIANLAYSRVCISIPPANSQLLVQGEYNFGLVISKTNLLVVQNIPNNVGAGLYQVYKALYDNLNDSILYQSAVGVAGIYQVKFAAGATSFTLKNPRFPVADTGAASFFNMNSLAYMGIFMGSGEPFLNIVLKSTFTIFKTITFPSSLTTNFQSVVGFGTKIVDNKWYFARIEDTNKNFQSYYLVFDNCTYRTETDVCTNCLTGYYRNTTLPGGDCILPADFLPKYGIHEEIVLMDNCQMTGCLNCLMNYSICVACDTSTTYYNMTNISTCLATANYPLKYGPNTSSDKLVPCSDSHCDKCSSTYTICTLCSAGYYLYAPNASCLNEPLVPAGYGINASNGTVTPCSDIHCTKCSAVYTTCTICNPGAGWYLYGTTCIDKPTFPTGKGVNTGAGTVVTCTATGCTNCVDDYTICTVCNSGSGYYVGDSTCYTTATMPAGKGPNTGTGAAVACSDLHCTKCSTLYTVCTICNPGAGWYLYGTTCIDKPSFPAGKGVNTGAGTVVTCSATGCTNCVDDYTVCTVCNSGSGYYLSSSTCYNSASMPAGKGPNTSSGAIVNCDDTGCIDCRTNYLDCIACNSGLGYYVGDLTCYNAATMPTGKGPNTGTGAVVACSDLHCTKCSAVYTTCTICNPGAGWYLYGTTCIDKPTFPTGKGVNTGAGTVVTCTATGCTNCVDDYTVCTVCNSGSGYYVGDSTCYTTATMPAGKGPNTGTGAAVACSDLHCTKCSTLYTVCTICNPGAGWYLYGTTCIDKPSFPAGKGVNTGAGTVVTCSATGCTNCVDDYTVCTVCNSGSGYYLSSSTCYNSASMPAGKGPNTSSGAIVNCDDTGCVDCRVNYLDCIACNSGSGYYVGDSTCYTTATMPAGKGPNTSTGAAVACSDLHCTKCSTLYTVCTICNPGAGWYLSGTSCLDKPSFPAGKGVNTGAGTVVTCSATGCTNCVNDYTICTVCNSGLGYYLLGSTCLTSATMPVGKGPNTSSGMVVTCDDTGCIDCRVNYLDCITCNSGSGYYAGDSTCYTTATMPIGKGPNTGTGVVLACQETGCANCSSTFITCVKCLNGSGYYLNGTDCLTLPEIVSGYGINSTNGTVVSCNSTGCLHCEANYQSCSQCDKVNGYFLNVSKCVKVVDMPVGWGGDISTGLVRACADTNCSNCRADYSNCISCLDPLSTYLSAGSCLAYTMPDGYGVNITDSNVVACATPNCQKCKPNHLVCQQCYQSGVQFYLQSNQCLQISLIPDGSGLNITDNTIVACATPNCQKCKSNHLICQECFLSGDQFYLESNQCKDVSRIPDEYGLDISDLTVVGCATSDCSKCKRNYLICQMCLQSGVHFYLESNQCLDILQIPDGYGLNIISSTPAACATANCSKCKYNNQICQMCFQSGDKFYLNSNLCLLISEMPQGYGYNSTTYGNSACVTNHCVDCASNSSVCVACDETNGYYLQGTTCVKSTVGRQKYAYTLIATKNPMKSETADISCILNFTQDIPDKAVRASLLNYLTANLSRWHEAAIYDLDKTDTVQRKYQLWVSNHGEVLSVSLKMVEFPSWPEFNIELFSKPKIIDSTKDFDFEINGYQYFENFLSATTDKKVHTVEDYGNIVSTMVGAPPAQNPIPFSVSLMLMLALDWTGIMLKFSQILKLMTKLYFININFGTRLDAFLNKIGEQLKTFQDPERSMKNVYNAKDYRGKLTKKRTNIDFVFTLWDKLIVYSASWILKAVNYLIKRQTYHVPRWYLYVLYFAPKVHLIIFNLVFIDFYWVITRTILHSRGLPFWNIVITYIIAELILFDVLEIVCNTLNLTKWLRYVKFMSRTRPVNPTSKSMKRVHKQNEVIARLKNSSHSMMRLPTTQTSASCVSPTDSPNGYNQSKFAQKLKVRSIFSKEEPSTTTNLDTQKTIAKLSKIERESSLISSERDILWEETYNSINADTLCMTNISTNIRKHDRKVLDSKISRANYDIHLTRVLSYHIIIPACQYASGICIGLLMIIEAAKLVHALYCYVKYKYLKNIICLLMEVFQSIAMFLFLTICFILHTKRFDELIMDFYQDAGIWIVIASCVAEYLLLLTYIGVATYDFFKNRKIEKERSASRMMSFIHFEKIRQKKPNDSKSEEDDFVQQKSHVLKKLKVTFVNENRPSSGALKSKHNKIVHYPSESPGTVDLASALSSDQNFRPGLEAQDSLKPQNSFKSIKQMEGQSKNWLKNVSDLKSTDDLLYSGRQGTMGSTKFLNVTVSSSKNIRRIRGPSSKNLAGPSNSVSRGSVFKSDMFTKAKHIKQ